MTNPVVSRDERTLAVENASYRWAYLFVTYGLLLLIAYRSFVARESNWDLLALVVVSGLVTTLYQGAHRVLSRRWAVLGLVTVLAAALVAAVIAFIH